VGGGWGLEGGGANYFANVEHPHAVGERSGFVDVS